MGLISFSLAVSAASLGPQLAPPETAVSQRETPSPAPAWRLPADTPPVPARNAARRDAPYPRVEEPASDSGRITLPSVDWWQGSAELKVKMTGIHFGWDF